MAAFGVRQLTEVSKGKPMISGSDGDAINQWMNRPSFSFSIIMTHLDM